jgi:hypothetical protein
MDIIVLTASRVGLTEGAGGAGARQMGNRSRKYPILTAQPFAKHQNEQQW